MADCTFGSWMTCAVALFQAVLSSICRFTQVVMIATTASRDARTTSTQTRMRRLRLSGAAALAVGATTAAVSGSIAWAASSHTGDTHDANDPNGFDVGEPGDDIFLSDGQHPGLSPVPRGLRPDSVGRACGRLAGGRLPDGAAI